MHQPTSIIIFLLIYVLAIILARFGIRRILGYFVSRCGRRRTCYQLPPSLQRHPDPCIYSQSYIQKFFPGTPVTWDNPDIWIEDEHGVRIGAHALLPDTSYIVRAKISNAAFVPAINTIIKCQFRDFGFGGDWIDVATITGDGNAVVLDISAWAHEVAAFSWRTPVTAGHYCVMVSINHPEDANPWNNEGQLNTDVVAISAGSSKAIDVSLPRGGGALTYNIFSYEIPRGSAELKFGFAQELGRRDRGQDIFYRHQQRGALILGAKARSSPLIQRSVADFRYYGRDQILLTQRQALRAVPIGWSVVVDTNQASRAEINIKVSGDAAPGTRVPLVITASDQLGSVIGGVTVIVEVN